MTLVKAPGVPASRRRLGYATALDAGDLLIPFKFRLLIHHTSLRLHRGRPRPRQHADWPHHHCVLLLPISTAARFGQRDWVRSRLRCDQANGENAACSARAPLKNGAAVRGGRLKIATDVAGMLGLSEALAKTGRSFSLGERGDRRRSTWDLVQLGAR